MYNLHVFSVKKYSSFRIAVVVVVVAGKGSLKCFEIRMPQVFQDSQVAGNIYASCDTPIGLLFSAVVIYDCWTYFLYEWENHPPWKEKKWDRLMMLGAGPPIQQQQQEKGKTQQRKVLQRSISVSPCLICTDDAPWPEGFDDSLLASLLCECNNSITWYILVLVARVRNTQ
jgi:hypothetical protein